MVDLINVKLLQEVFILLTEALTQTEKIAK